MLSNFFLLLNRQILVQININVGFETSSVVLFSDLFYDFYVE